MKEDDKNTRKEAFEFKIKNLEEKISRNQMAEETKFKIMKDQIAKLNEGIQNEEMTRDILDEKKAKETKISENNI